jgi:heptosyltransferase-2
VSSPQRILVVQPSWVGDAVMATPTLRALRQQYPEAKITYLLRRYVKPVYAGMPWADRLVSYRVGKTAKKAGRDGVVRLARRLRAGKFDLAVLLPNSFKSALVCKLAGIPRIVGYDRDGRGFLLSDRLIPPKENGKFPPFPIVKYYLSLAQFLGATTADTAMELFVTPHERADAEAVLARAGLSPAVDRPWRSTGAPPLVILNPGAQYGAAKLWLPEYFAEVSDTLQEQRGATVLVSSAPKERAIVEAISKHAKRPFIDLAKHRMSLGALKDIVRRCDLMVTNDTGPRHIAAAFGVPVVTVFGPTHPRWTDIDFALERQVAIKVVCGPCQLKKCPLDHRCMTGVTPNMVLARTGELLTRTAPAVAAST